MKGAPVAMEISRGWYTTMLVANAQFRVNLRAGNR
jgi:hypothetical protein